MFQLYADSTGYISSESVITYNKIGVDHIYLATPIVRFAGILKFNKSINQILNLEAQNWEEVNINSAKITLFS
jgi:hypothetical protein